MKKGVLGGLILILIAVVWFFGGLAIDRIFYYPPVLLIIGIVAIIKGVLEDNLAGEKYRRTYQFFLSGLSYFFQNRNNFLY